MNRWIPASFAQPVSSLFIPIAALCDAIALAHWAGGLWGCACRGLRRLQRCRPALGQTLSR